MTQFGVWVGVACFALATHVALPEEPGGHDDRETVEASIDTARLEEMESLAKAWLDFMIKTQRSGALPTTVTVNPDTGEVAPFTQVINDDSAVSLGQPFLWAYRIWRDERYRRAAVALADFYVQAQFPEGGWAYAFTLQPDGNVEPVWSIANFEEWVQSNGLRHLMAVYYLTGEEKYKQAAMKAGEVILRAQDPSGWWPWGAAIGPEDQRADYMKGPTLNDWNLNACLGDCLVLYHATGDRRYLDAIRKAGAWILSAQIEGPTPGWAAQYDRQGQPAWARFMEPPGVDTAFGTYGAGSALLMLYDLTGDERYLAPLRTHLAWLQSIPPEKKGWLWYAHRSWSAEENQGKPSDYTKNLTEQFGGTLPSEEALAGIAIEAGEPIVAYHYQMVPVDHPEVQCYLKPLNGHYGSRSEQAEEWLANELEQRSQGPLLPGWREAVPTSQRGRIRPTPAACAAAYNPDHVADLVSQFKAWRSGQAVQGLVEIDGREHRVDVGRGCAHAVRLLREIALAKVALGQASPDIIPMYRPLGYFGDIALVQPTCDWYDVEWPAH